MTQPKYTNADCPLYGSEYCAALNMESCEKCTVDCTDEEKTARVKQDLADMAALLPEDGMAKLFTGEECVLCKGEKGKREYYAFFDMGHPGARKHRTKGLLGLLKKEPRFGSLLPAQAFLWSFARGHLLFPQSGHTTKRISFKVTGRHVRHQQSGFCSLTGIHPGIISGIFCGAFWGCLAATSSRTMRLMPSIRSSSTGSAVSIRSSIISAAFALSLHVQPSGITGELPAS